MSQQNIAVPCPACAERRVHVGYERREHHPYAGHGYNGTVWTHPDLVPLDVVNTAGAANLAANLGGGSAVEVGAAPAVEDV